MNQLNRLSLAAAAAVSVAIAACGGGGGSEATSNQTPRQQFQEAALKHAECMRRNGVDVPDPKPNGGIVIDDTGADPERVRQAEEKCRKYLDDLPAPELSEADQREFRERALEQAECMRENGIDMPDPKFGANGQVTIELDDDIPVDDPRFQAADKKCREQTGIGQGPGPAP